MAGYEGPGAGLREFRREETFAPILSMFEADGLEDAIVLHNDVDQGLSSWKAFMRRPTNTINWGRELPLAQEVKFDV